MSLRLAGLRLVLTLGLLLPAVASAWNAAGHRLVAAIAWQEMTAADRTAVVALLAAHPDAGRWQRKVRPGEDHDLVLFTEAATWADDIRRDERFYDEGREAETPTLAGFPDMARRRGWHYLNLAVGDGRGAGAPGGELDQRIRRLGETLTDPASAPSSKAYALAWLIHLVGDIHQPLHVATRHDEHGDHDGGGNGLAVFDPDNARNQDTNLHAWWDDLPGQTWLRGSRLLATAEYLRQTYPAAEARIGATGDIDLWRDESFRLAKSFVYAAWSSAPVTISSEYRTQALRLGGERITLAGYRLGRLLGDLLPGGRGKRQNARGAEPGQDATDVTRKTP